MPKTHTMIENAKEKLAHSFAPELLGGAAGAGAGGALSLGALSLLGTSGLSAAGISSGLASAGALVGGGMAAGVLVLAAPAALLAGVGVGVAAHMKHEKQTEIYKEALRAQSEAIEALQREVRLDKQNIADLSSMNLLLEQEARELRPARASAGK